MVCGARIMIKSIYSQSLEQKKVTTSASVSSKADISPVQNTICSQKISNYSVNNLRANYMPISFRGEKDLCQDIFPNTGGETKTYLPGAKLPLETGSPETIRALYMNKVPYDTSFNMVDLAEEEKIKGSFYREATDDLSILLKSDKDAMIISEHGASNTTFIHKFMERINNCDYSKIGLSKMKTDVIYIEDPMAYAISHYTKLAIQQTSDDELLELYAKKAPPNVDLRKATDPNIFLSALMDLNDQKGHKKVVFIRDFDKVSSMLSSLFRGKSMKQTLVDEFPNLHIVGMMDKNVLKTPALDEPFSETDVLKLRNIKKNMEDFTPLQVQGLTTKEMEDFIKKNPEYQEGTFAKYWPFKVKISPSADKKLIAQAAKNFDMAFPASYFIELDRVAAAKLNEAKSPDSLQAAMTITTSDIERFVDRHKALVNDVSTNPDVKIELVENITTTMDQIAGLDSAKSKFEDIFEYMKDPKRFLASGRRAPGGVLLTGEAGTGKTELAMAVAGEIKKLTGKNVPFFKMSDFGNSYINSIANGIDNSYADVRKYMKKTGAEFGILFIDEADRIGKKIGRINGHDEDDKATNAWKEQLAGVKAKTSKEKIITIAVSNHPEVFAPELLRPERLMQIHCALPTDNPTIEKLLQIHSEKLPFENEFEKTLLLSELADDVKGLNGDQMVQILDEATRIALKDNKNIGRQEIVDGLFQTLYGAKIKNDYALEDRLLTTAHEVGHALNTPAHERLVAILNESRDVPGIGPANALCRFAPKKGDIHTTFDTVIDEIACAYGGGEAEKLIRPAHASGVSNDYSKISELIEYAVKKGNLGVYTPAISFYKQDGKEMLHLSKQHAKAIAMDNRLFAETGQKISSIKVNFYKDLVVNRYLKENEEALTAGHDGKNYLGAEFDNMVNEWLKASKMEKAKPVLDDGITAIKTIAFNDKFWTRQAGIRNARNIMNSGIESIIGLSQERHWLEDSTKTTENLTKCISQLSDLAKNGSKWLENIGHTGAEEKLAKTVKSIVAAAKGKEAGNFIEKIAKKVAHTVR